MRSIEAAELFMRPVLFCNGRARLQLARPSIWFWNKHPVYPRTSRLWIAPQGATPTERWRTYRLGAAAAQLGPLLRLTAAR